MFTLRHRRLITLWTRLSLVLLIISIYNCAQMPVYQEEVYYRRLRYPSVRVKLLETKEDLVVSPAGSFVIRCHSQKGDVSEYFSSAQIWLKIKSEGISLGAKGEKELEGNQQKIVFEPRGKNEGFSLSGKKYRGVLEVIYLPENNQALALNIVFMEDYLKGVLPFEIGKWTEKELEALKAQAIASRTYALYSLGNYQEKGYDLESTVADQIYQGADSEEELTNLAINKTKGMILTYEGKPIKAHYHANCGGCTEKIEEVWNKPAEPYHHSFGDDGYCTWAKNSTWEESWSREELEEILSKYLSSHQQIPKEGLGKILNLEVIKRSPSGRVSLLELRTDKNLFRLEKDSIRWVLRRNNSSYPILPSTLFDIYLQKDTSGEVEKIVFKGFGNGHGVGMCQVGALGRARAGQSYRAILSHYYRGAKIVKLY
jgi:stage II sporulation protein D